MIYRKVLIKRNKDKNIKRLRESIERLRGVDNNTSPILIPLTIDWKYTWDERCQAIRDQIRNRTQQSVHLETL